MKKKRAIGKFSYQTDMGKVRLSNEDQALAMTNSKGDILLIVCDGMGGQSHGEVASKLAVEIFQEEFEKNPFLPNPFFEKVWMRNVANKINKIIFKESETNEIYKGMGTTLTAVIVSGTHITVGQIGDSRLYWLQNREFSQLTIDQTYVESLYRNGKISKEEMEIHPERHVLLNALGTYPVLNIDLSVHKYNKETLLLCSDGLYNNVSPKDMETIMKLDDSPQQKCDELISLANANGGSDNIAIVYWEAR